MNNDLLNKIKLKKKEYENALNNYNNSLQKLNFVYEKYIENPKTYEDNLKKIIKDYQGNKYFVTSQGILKPIGDGDLNDDCPANQSVQNFAGLVPNQGEMMNVPLDASKPLPDIKDNDNFYMSGSSLSNNQPCSYFGQQVSINLPDKSSNRQMKSCTYVFNDPSQSNMIEHDDLTNATLEECSIRAEDLGHDAFGIVNTNISSLKGTCVTGDKSTVPTHSGEHDTTQTIIDTNKNKSQLTLLKNGNLIMWEGKSNYYDSENNLNTSAILWSSEGNGGKIDNKCDPIYGGSINTINVTYGTNCGLNLF